MRVALIYPPPWKIPRPGDAPPPRGEGPPADFVEGDLDSDFFQTPYGLFSLGAQAIRAGHHVKVLNLSGFAWSRVEEVLSALDADVYGMSCWTANRRGVGYVARLMKRLRPRAPVVIGGPHATPLGQEMLEHHPEIDLVTLGESEDTFHEILERVASGASLTGIAGTVYREEGRAVLGPERPAIANLDTLESPHRHFDTHIVMTSRGCPWQCTFCGAETSWGRGFRGQSIPYVVDSLASALERVPVKMVQIKDDTFTANRKRALQICQGIRQRGLSFLWSCDTRVDVLSEELLREMRLAGCQRLSLGVESGSQPILDAINKKISVQEIVDAAQMAKKFGIRVRFYMMLGNRGETAATFRETLAFLDRAKPHEYLFSCLSIYPGTTDFDDAEKAGWLKREVYFSGDFQELKTPFDATPEDAKLMSDWFAQNKGLRVGFRETSGDFRAILDRLGDYHAAHLDLAGALYHEGDLGGAEHHAKRALELGHPCPGLCLNYLACIAFRRGDVPGMQELFLRAAKTDPQHDVLIQNVQRARTWFKERGPERQLPLELDARHDFILLERNTQPSLPGPLPDDFAVWHDHAAPAAPPLVEAGRLRVV
ncbi:MAG: B12-binding domain-containing radical SAM protein [Myxococcales bacterium]|nr:B12-binding domain-containing radical SAM protein [Myxococcales bacterium]